LNSHTQALRPPNLVNPALVKALAHATRVHAMSVLSTRASSSREVAGELKLPPNNVAYHFEILERLGCIELAYERPAADGRVREFFYRATTRPYFDEEAWNRLSDNEKLKVAIPVIRLISEDVKEAMATCTFFDPDDNHLTRTPMVVDKEGWDEQKAVLAKTLDELLAIEERVAERREQNKDMETMPTRVAIMHFRYPETEGTT
jgi:predicted ArsR family transcriptional regulator